LDPIFLETEEILRIHSDQIKRYGGCEGVRDSNLLESAAAMPKATFSNEFLHKDIFEMAAAYLFHIVKDHPFLDGNKRTGAVVSVVFLNFNDWKLDADEQTLEDMVRSVAEGRINKEQVAQCFRENCSSA
jgi:death-on-curing protein